MKNLPSRYPARGVSVRRIDHLALLCNDVAANRGFAQELLGLRLHEQVLFDDGATEIGSWLSPSPLHHQVAYVVDVKAGHARLHHFAMWVDEREDVLRAADVRVRTACSSRPGRRSTTIPRGSICTAMSRGATGWRSIPAASWCWRRTSSRCAGTKPTVAPGVLGRRTACELPAIRDAGCAGRRRDSGASVRSALMRHGSGLSPSPLREGVGGRGARTSQLGAYAPLPQPPPSRGGGVLFVSPAPTARRRPGRSAAPGSAVPDRPECPPPSASRRSSTAGRLPPSPAAPGPSVWSHADRCRTA